MRTQSLKLDVRCSGSSFEQLDELDERVTAVDVRIRGWHQANPTSQRLAEVPGVGPLIATAIVATVGDGSLFRSGENSPLGPASPLGQDRGPSAHGHVDADWSVDLAQTSCGRRGPSVFRNRHNSLDWV
jgi:hypothetical protein